MIGSYFSPGIVLKYGSEGEWVAAVEFYDSGFVNNRSTEGRLYTRYFVDIETAIDVIIEDATRLGIDLRKILLGYRDGESKTWPMPKNWKEILREQANRIGWHSAYESPLSEDITQEQTK